MNPDERCETMIRECPSAQNMMRFGWSSKREQCPNGATLLITVKGQGKMRICDSCLPEFRKYATLPWTVKTFKLKKRKK